MPRNTIADPEGMIAGFRRSSPAAPFSAVKSSIAMIVARLLERVSGEELARQMGSESVATLRDLRGRQQAFDDDDSLLVHASDVVCDHVRRDDRHGGTMPSPLRPGQTR